jgi:predicted nucleotidyltransferase
MERNVVTINNKKVIELTRIFTGKIESVLGKNLHSIYIHGFIALGDFSDDTSDIDLLVICNQTLGQCDFEKLYYLHNDLCMVNVWGSRIECSYITLDQFLSVSRPSVERIYYNKTLKWEKYGPEWYIEKHIIATASILIHGQDLNLQNHVLDENELRKVITEIVLNTWSPLIDKLNELENNYIVYLVLTMCRIIHSMEQGQIYIKAESAYYTMEKFKDNPLTIKIIKDSLDWTEGYVFDLRKGAVTFIRNTIMDYS